MWLFYVLVVMLPFYHNKFVNYRIGGLSIIKYVGILCFVAALFHLKQKRTPTRFIAAAHSKLFLLLATWALLSYVRMITLGISVPETGEIYYSLLLLFFLTITLVDSWAKFRRAILASIMSLGLASVYLIREFRLYQSVYVDFRPGYTTGDPNYYASSALVVMPLAIAWIQCDRRPVWRWFVMFAIGLMVVGLGLSSSRGGFIGLAAMLFFILVRNRKRLARNLLILLVISIPLALAPHGPVDRFLNPRRGDKEAIAARLQNWKVAIEMVSDHPLIGVGLGQFIPARQKYEEQGSGKVYIAHNAYLEYAAELGIPALCIFLWLLYATFRSLQRIERTAARVKNIFVYRFSEAMQASLLGFAVSSFFLSAEYQKVFWFLVFMAIAMGEMTRGVAFQQQQPLQGTSENFADPTRKAERVSNAHAY